MELYWIKLSFARRRAPLNKIDKFYQVAELCEFEVK